MNRSHLAKKLLAGPFVFWMVAFTIIPLIFMAFYAFTTKGGDFTLANVAAIGNSLTFKSLVNSLYYSILTTVVCLIIAYPLALILRNLKHGNAGLVIFAFVLPMWMNILLRTFAWQSILENSGVLNGILGALGLPLVHVINTPFAVVLGMVYDFLPFMVLPLYNAVAKIDQSVVNAAYDLGAGKMRTVWSVIIPQSLPGIISGITMVFVPSLTSFAVSQILGGGKVMLIGNIIEQQFMTYSDWNTGAGLSMVLMVFVLLSMMVLNHFDKTGEGRAVQ